MTNWQIDDTASWQKGLELQFYSFCRIFSFSCFFNNCLSRRYDTKYIGTQPINTQHNETQQTSIQYNDTQNVSLCSAELCIIASRLVELCWALILNVIILSVVLLNVVAPLNESKIIPIKYLKRDQCHKAVLVEFTSLNNKLECLSVWNIYIIIWHLYIEKRSSIQGLPLG